MHLKFPKDRRVYTWEELSCLSRAIGFQSDTLKKCLPDEITLTEPVVSVRDLFRLMDRKYFNEALDRTFNMHTADYNINVLKKSLKLLEHRFLSFTELNDVRIAYQAYEAGDMKGMIIDKHTLLRTLKLCGRVVAPMKLMHRVKHMKDHFDECGRIQLYEFMDLLVLCDLAEDITVEETREGAIDKNWRHLFKMDDFDPLFVTGEEKVQERLDQVFMDTELNYGDYRLGDRKIPKEHSVNREAIKEQVRFHSQRYKQLQGFIDDSSRQVKKSKAGTRRSRPTSAPAFERLRTSLFTSNLRQRPNTVDQSDGFPMDSEEKLKRLLNYTKNKGRHGIQSAPSSLYVEASEPPIAVRIMSPNSKFFRPFPPSMQFGTLPFRPQSSRSEAESQQSLRPWMKSVPYQRPSTPACITDTDMIGRQNLIDSLQYEIETLEEKTLQVLNEEIDVLLPSYRKRREERLRNQKPPLPPRKVTKKKKEGLTEEQIKRLSQPEPRAFMGTHEKLCDARTRAIAPSRDSRRGLDRKASTPREIQNETKRSSETSSEKDKLFTHHARLEILEDGSSSDINTGYTDMSRLRAYLLSSRLRQIDPKGMDRHRFDQARVGSAAILYDFLMEKDSGKEEERERNQANQQTTEEEDSGIDEGKKKPEEQQQQQHAHIGMLGKRLSGIDELKINGMDLSEFDKLTVVSKDDTKSKSRGSKSVRSKSPVSVKSSIKSQPKLVRKTSAFEQRQTAAAMTRLSMALSEPAKSRTMSSRGERSQKLAGIATVPAKHEVRFHKKSWKNNKQMKQLVESKKLSIRLKQPPSE
ncbi:uncharacterized protein [Ptychodera flava]|uniref:uncharacterized protein isoform X2 n=1 Tax=Ptychodera flava TaxID=63121 RepID=UPI00396A54B5